MQTSLITIAYIAARANGGLSMFTIRLFLVIVFLAAAARLTFGQGVQPPTPVSPASMEQMDNGCFDRSDRIEWDFEWQAVPNARKYHLYVKSRSAPIPVVDNKGLGKTTYKHRRDKAYIGGRGVSIWSWKVRALVGKTWTEWSEEREFRIEPLDTDCK